MFDVVGFGGVTLLVVWWLILIALCVNAWLGRAISCCLISDLDCRRC